MAVRSLYESRENVDDNNKRTGAAHGLKYRNPAPPAMINDITENITHPSLSSRIPLSRS